MTTRTRQFVIHSVRDAENGWEIRLGPEANDPWVSVESGLHKKPLIGDIVELLVPEVISIMPGTSIMPGNTMSIQQISREILIQNNRCTEAPIWIVQEAVKVYGVDEDHRDDYVWLNEDAEEADEETATALEKQEEPEGWEKVGYKTFWRFVTACFTEAGCKAFIEEDGHNHRELRIYAAGSYRNAEWRTVRNYLLSQAEVT